MEVTTPDPQASPPKPGTLLGTAIKLKIENVEKDKYKTQTQQTLMTQKLTPKRKLLLLDSTVLSNETGLPGNLDLSVQYVMPNWTL